MRPVTWTLAESSGSLPTLHSCFSQSTGIAIELDLTTILIMFGEGGYIGALLGEGWDEDRLTSGQQGKEDGREPCADPGPEGLASTEIR